MDNAMVGACFWNSVIVQTTNCSTKQTRLEMHRTIARDITGIQACPTTMRREPTKRVPKKKNFKLENYFLKFCKFYAIWRKPIKIDGRLEIS